MHKTIIYISDAHIGKTPDEARVLFRLIDRMSETFVARSTLVIFLGDNTDDGEESQRLLFRLAIDRLESRGFSVLVIIGNHDVSPDGWQGVREDLRIAQILETIVERPLLAQTRAEPPWHCDFAGRRIILVDTTADLAGGSPFDLARGRVGARQREEIKRLALDFEGPRDLCLHNHPTFRTNILPGDVALLDVEEILALIEEVGFDLVICGHKHVYEELTIAGARVALACEKTTQENAQGLCPVIVATLEEGSPLVAQRVFI